MVPSPQPPTAAPGVAAPPGPAVAFRADPEQGRLFTVSRIVRSTDVTPEGRLRFDALARYLQQAAEDDLADAAAPEPCVWLVRRITVAVRGYPAHGDVVSLRTFCSATGPRWAERTTTLAGPSGDLMQAAAVWAATLPADGGPVPLGPEFHRIYGPSAGGRQVSARLSHPPPPAAAPGRPWPLRTADFDTVGHVNNSVHWAAVEDLLAGLGWLPSHAELEYHRPVRPGQDPRLLFRQEPGRLCAWLCAGPQRLASAVIRGPAPSALPPMAPG